MSATDLVNVETYSGGADGANIFATDHYEILRVGPQADSETLERVYRTLAERFHPDNPITGDRDLFLRLSEAYQTLSNPAERAKYNVLRQTSDGSARFSLRGKEFFDGVRGGQNRRLAVLCVLYRRRIGSQDSPGLTILDLELLTGCTRDELASGLWYLCEKKWATIGEFTQYMITVDGFDVVESKLEERMELRALATLCYYGSSAEQEVPAQIEPRLWIEDTLPSDFDAIRTTDGSVSNSDHYETLNIGPEADEEAIERVYRELASRFDSGEAGADNAQEFQKFQKIREAYETLADPASRAQYDALRQRTKGSARFRLRGREFFDGFRGEQNRRLAVLCLLYRQALSELPGLTVLDLEQLTGCTREELGSALWYLREKKWARPGEYTEYSITAMGFDVVENAVQSASQSRQSLAVMPHSPVSKSIVLESRNSRLIAESEQTEIIAGEAHNMEIALKPMPVETKPQEREAVRYWDALCPEDSYASAPASQQPGAPAAAAPNTVASEPQAVQRPAKTVRAQKRVVFSMGGKGGVGKTNVMSGLAEWFGENQIPVTLLDLDTENKAKGSLTHFFDGAVPKINIHTPAGLDAFIDILAADSPAILADMGAGAGQVTHDWFGKMYPDCTDAGIVFTAIGVITSDPASVESVLNWAEALENRVDYIVVENNLTEQTDFTYWRENSQAEEFRRRFRPAILRLDYRLADLENAIRTHGITLGRVADRKVTQPELQRASLVMRAQSYRRRMFAEFDKVKELLLP